MKILFIGGTGNISAAASRLLVQKGHELAAVAEAAGVEACILHIPSDFIAAREPSLAGTLLGDKAHSVLFDNTKIKTFVPGYQALISFREGIRRTLDWFEASPDRMRCISQSRS